jgi:hypothetical protein
MTIDDLTKTFTMVPDQSNLARRFFKLLYLLISWKQILVFCSSQRAIRMQKCMKIASVTDV